MKSRVVLMRLVPPPSCSKPESITATVTPAPVSVVAPAEAGLIDTPPAAQAPVPDPVVVQLIGTEAAPGALAPIPQMSPPDVPVFPVHSCVCVPVAVAVDTARLATPATTDSPAPEGSVKLLEPAEPVAE